MGQKQMDTSILALLMRPAFCVAQGVITQVNSEAGAYLLQEGMQIEPLLEGCLEEYRQFHSGCLYLTLQLCGQSCGAWIHCQEQQQVFLLEQPADLDQLRTLALAAQQLREPLAGMMAAVERVVPAAAREGDDAVRVHAAQMNRRMFQLLRMVGNMSDALQLAQGNSHRQETVNLAVLLDEILEEAAHLVGQAGLQLQYSSLPSDAYTLADRDQLERAILNLLSNAIKASPAGGKITVNVAQRKDRVAISVTDHGPGISTQVLGNLYGRFLRTPTLEGTGSGLGLGMVLVRNTALQHSGTVLIDQPEGAGTRVTLTLKLRTDSPGTLRTPIMRVDYTGERSHALVELSDVLPAALYDSAYI